MARRYGRRGDYLATDDLTGFTVYGSRLRQGYYGEMAVKPLERNLQEIASPLNDPRPVPVYRGPNYETYGNCIGALAPLYVGNTAVRTIPNAATKALALIPGIGDMAVECSFEVYPSPSSYITSIEQFEVTIQGGATSATCPIRSVDTTHAVIFYEGFTTSHTGTALREFMGRVALTNATTVTGSRDTSNANFTVTLRGTVVEFAASAITSVQHSTVVIGASSSSGTAPINSVNTSRSALFYLGTNISTSTTANANAHARIVITDATTVTATRAASSTAILTIGIIVVEFAAAVIASVQQRSLTLSTTATSSTDTISGVNPANTLLLYNGVSSNTGTLATYYYNLQLTNTSTVTLTRTGASSTSRIINYTVLELQSGIINSIQRGTTAIASAISADTPVNNTRNGKNLCNWLHFNQTGTIPDQLYATAKLADSQTVRAQKITAGAVTSTPAWEIIEFV